MFGWLLISGVSRPAYPLPDYAWFCLCFSLCILGCVVMIAADAQKYFTLRVHQWHGLGRGNRADYDGWAEASNAGWDFHSVLPLFKKSEDWEDGDVHRSPARCGR